MLLRRYHEKIETKKELENRIALNHVEVVKVEEIKEEIDYDQFTVFELKLMAKSKNVEGYSQMRKSELIEALRGE